MRFRLLAAAAVVVYAAACSDDAQQDPNPNEFNRPAFAPPAVANPYCQPVTVGGIQTEIHNLYVQNAWPNENSAQGKFNNVQSVLGGGDLNGARTATRSLVAFVTLKFNQLTA